MKVIIIILLCLSIFLIGCSSEYDDCKYDCYAINKNCSWGIIVNNPCFYNDSFVKEKCFNECK